MRPPTLLPLICLLALAGCRGEGPEAKLRRTFQDGIRAVEAGDAAGASTLLAPDFAGPDGMDRAGARFFLAGTFARRKVGVTVLSQKFELDGARAVQAVDLLLTAKAPTELVPGERSRHSLLIRWELRDGRWVMREVQETGES